MAVWRARSLVSVEKKDRFWLRRQTIRLQIRREGERIVIGSSGFIKIPVGKGKEEAAAAPEPRLTICTVVLYRGGIISDVKGSLRVLLLKLHHS